MTLISPYADVERWTPTLGTLRASLAVCPLLPQIKAHNLGPALDWAQQHRSQLSHGGAPILTELPQISSWSSCASHLMNPPPPTPQPPRSRLTTLVLPWIGRSNTAASCHTMVPRVDLSFGYTSSTFSTLSTAADRRRRCGTHSSTLDPSG